MKINFGNYRNKKIESPKNLKMRPTTSFVKSIIFNTLNFNNIEIVLDAFAGTGALGLESLSMGVGKVIFCDNNIHSIKSIRMTLEKMEINKNKYEIINGDFRQVLKSNLIEKYDLIFLDPPFSVEKYFNESLQLIYDKKKLSDEGIIVLETSSKLHLNEINLFKIQKEKKYGDKKIYFLTLK